MPGPMGHFVYTDDTGANFRIRMSTIDAALQGATAAADQPELPAGSKPRVRYFRHPTSGRERRVIVCSPTSPLYSSAIGTAFDMIDYAGLTATPPTVATPGWLASGRTGEKVKAI